MPGTVFVCCKIPNGVTIDVADITWTEVDGIKVAVRDNIRAVKLNGSADRRRMDNAGQIAEVSHVVGDFGITIVDADFWEKWLSENPNYAPVKAGMIFAMPKQNDARAKAKDMAGKRSGLEPMEPPVFNRAGDPVGTIDPRLPTGIRTADPPLQMA